MGKPKLLLAWRQTTVLGHLINLWKSAAIREIAVVIAAGDTAIAQELDRLGIPSDRRIANPQPERGMFSSIQCASRWQGWSAGVTHFAIALGDQPQIAPETLQSVLSLAALHPEGVCQPSRNGRGRHPVVLPRAIFTEVQHSAAPDFKAFLASYQKQYVELLDTGLDLDLDTPADYQRALTSL